MKKMFFTLAASFVATLSFAQTHSELKPGFDIMNTVGQKIQYTKAMATHFGAKYSKPKEEDVIGLYIKESTKDENPTLIYLAKDTIMVNGHMTTFEGLCTAIKAKGDSALQAKAKKDAEKAAKKAAALAKKSASTKKKVEKSTQSSSKN